MQRNKKSKVVVMSLILALTLTNCATQVSNTGNLPSAENKLTDLLPDNSISQISGTVHFPENINNTGSLNTNQIITKIKDRIKNSKFKDILNNRRLNTKAVVEDVVSSSTVSLLYPSDFGDSCSSGTISACDIAPGEFEPGANVTIATGKSSSSGRFTIDLGDFVPDEEQVYVLEAVKRLGGPGHYIVTLRTHVRWNGTKWESMTTPRIDLNLVTTALAIISNLDSGRVPSNQTIGKIPVSGSIAEVNDILDDEKNLMVEEGELREVIDLENQVLAEHQDPFAAIFYDGGYGFTPTEQVATDIPINSSTENSQLFPSTAMDSDGDYVVTWVNFPQINPSEILARLDNFPRVSKLKSRVSNKFGIAQAETPYGIMARRYNKAGVVQIPEGCGEEAFPECNPETGEFLVNEFNSTTNISFFPKAAMDDDGDFVITWSGKYAEGNSGVFARRYSSAGLPQGSEFIVDSFTTTNQFSISAAAMDSDGDFVITWANKYAEGIESGVFAKRYNNQGEAQGSEFMVNTSTSGFYSSPSAAMDDNGDFVITWTDKYQEETQTGVLARRYNNLGEAQGAEFQVDSFSTTDQLTMSSVAMDSDGDFVIAWAAKYPDEYYDAGIFAKRYNKNGVSQGAEFIVRTPTTAEANFFPGVAMDSIGKFVIAWNNLSIEDGDLFGGVFARRYNSSGSPLDSEFQVFSNTSDNSLWGSISMDSGGDFVVAGILSNDPIDSKYELFEKGEVFARRYNSYAIPK